jgi:Type II secretion system (T2SS), protein M subtype b
MTGANSRMLHRLAAIGLLLAVIGAVGMLVVAPLASYFATLRSNIATERETLGRFEAFAANKDAASALAERSEAAMHSGIFLNGETDALRTANLQALVTDVAQSEGVRLSSTRALPVQEANGLRFLGVQAECEADLRQLQAMILAVEARRPYLFIQSLQIAPVAGRSPDNEALKVRFGIIGAVATMPVGEAKL